jgi:hypothetical protein
MFLQHPLLRLDPADEVIPTVPGPAQHPLCLLGTPPPVRLVQIVISVLHSVSKTSSTTSITFFKLEARLPHSNALATMIEEHPSVDAPRDRRAARILPRRLLHSHLHLEVANNRHHL